MSIVHTVSALLYRERLSPSLKRRDSLLTTARIYAINYDGNESVRDNAMTPDEVGMLLHDRATRGEVLTIEEQSQLDDWYALQDAQEIKSLQTHDTSSDTVHLRTQIATALERLASTTQQIQDITVENDTIRDEIAVLRQQLISVESA